MCECREGKAKKQLHVEVALAVPGHGQGRGTKRKRGRPDVHHDKDKTPHDAPKVQGAVRRTKRGRAQRSWEETHAIRSFALMRSSLTWVFDVHSPTAATALFHAFSFFFFLFFCSSVLQTKQPAT